MPRLIHLTADRFPGRPGLDAAVSRALLERVAGGRLPETIRLFVPDRILAFGRRDSVKAGYRAATEAARRAGFAPIERLAGGKAAAFHEHTLAIAWAIPEPAPAETIDRRFAEIATLVADALAALGVDARIGEVPGEYCPGAYSVNAGGRRKLMGAGQRLVRNGAHIGAVVVVDHPDLVNRPLVPVYRHLGYDWDPDATGAVAREVPASVDTVAESITTVLRSRHEVRDFTIDEATIARAAKMVPGD
jgi:octanoyl-[GcvH]:protein N-octanoyltransferase